MLKTINPTTGNLIKEYPLLTENELKQIIKDCHHDFLTWSVLSYSERAEKMAQLSSLLLKNKKNLAQLIAEEMGKPITQGEAEVEKCSWVCQYYAENTETLLQARVIKSEFSKSYVIYEPMGIVLGIMPWNFPIWQVFRSAIPVLMGGNAYLLKHAEISTGTGLEIEKLFQQVEFPPHLFRALLISSHQTENVIAHPNVSGVTLTGSIKAGRAVSSTAGKYLKKSVLELGGNDPYIVLRDADLERAADACITSRLNNNGQVCIAAKRIIAVDAIYEELLSLIKEKMQKYRIGNPLEKNTQLGPLARADLRETVHDQVQRSIGFGATLLLGGELPNTPGFFYPPTLLKDVKPGSPAFDEEIFGPIITIIHAKDTEEALQLANQSEYGLGAAIFTNNIKLGEEIAAHRLKAGSCAVNAFVRSDPRLPFGGIKNSGFGRELGLEGLTSFLNIKTISIQ